MSVVESDFPDDDEEEEKRPHPVMYADDGGEGTKRHEELMAKGHMGSTNPHRRTLRHDQTGALVRRVDAFFPLPDSPFVEPAKRDLAHKARAGAEAAHKFAVDDLRTHKAAIDEAAVSILGDIDLRIVAGMSPDPDAAQGYSLANMMAAYARFVWAMCNHSVSGLDKGVPELRHRGAIPQGVQLVWNDAFVCVYARYADHHIERLLFAEGANTKDGTHDVYFDPWLAPAPIASYVHARVAQNALAREMARTRASLSL